MAALYLLVVLVSLQAAIVAGAFSYNREAPGGFYTYAAADPVYTKIALEEHVSSSAQGILAAALGQCPDAACTNHIRTDLLDYSSRIGIMNNTGIDFAVLSMTSPGVQGITNRTLAEQTAYLLNNELARGIAPYPNRLGGYAALSMHDPLQAAAELTRAVVNLGFFGGLVNDFQQTGNGETLIFYDTAAWDPFWAVVQELNTTIYIHPRFPTAGEISSVWYSHKNLTGAVWQFAEGVSRSTLGLCLNGVFDRFPAVKVVIGHLGERIPYDFQRTDYLMERFSHLGVAKMNFRAYFERNVWITTSGHFSTPSLTLALNSIGPERIMFSTDYPYDYMEDAADWFDNLEIAHHDKKMMAQTTALNLFNLTASMVGPTGTRTFDMLICEDGSTDPACNSTNNSGNNNTPAESTTTTYTNSSTHSTISTSTTEIHGKSSDASIVKGAGALALLIISITAVFLG